MTHRSEQNPLWLRVALPPEGPALSSRASMALSSWAALSVSFYANDTNLHHIFVQICVRSYLCIDIVCNRNTRKIRFHVWREHKIVRFVNLCIYMIPNVSNKVQGRSIILFKIMVVLIVRPSRRVRKSANVTKRDVNCEKLLPCLSTFQPFVSDDGC